jgi:hypothetical protein
LGRGDAANAAGRLAGKEFLKFANDEASIVQLKDRIAKTIDYLKDIKQSEIDGTESKEISITFPSGQTRQFTGQSLLLGDRPQPQPNMEEVRSQGLRTPVLQRRRRSARHDRDCICCQRRQRLAVSIQPPRDIRASYPVFSQMRAVCCS